MFLTNILLKKVKTKFILVQIKSLGSWHTRCTLRERTSDKVEIILWDPLVRQQCVYRETKRLKGGK